MGFCLFGNVALAAHYARRTHGADRVLIVDWDVHHGNGTQALVEHDPGIHFVSMHQWPWYPGTGAASDRGIGNVWNVPLPRRAAAASATSMRCERAIDAATAGFTPDLVLISAGFDSLARRSARRLHARDGARRAAHARAGASARTRGAAGAS